MGRECHKEPEGGLGAQGDDRKENPNHNPNRNIAAESGRQVAALGPQPSRTRPQAPAQKSRGVPSPFETMPAP